MLPALRLGLGTVLVTALHLAALTPAFHICRRRRLHAALQRRHPLLQRTDRLPQPRDLGVVRPPQQKLQRIAHAPRDLTRLLGPRQGLVVDPQQFRSLHLALLPNQVPQELAQPEPPQPLGVHAPVAVHIPHIHASNLLNAMSCSNCLDSQEELAATF